jgi:hypothetical protein
VAKSDNTINTITTSDKAESYFCFNTVCYNAGTMAATIELQPNETFGFYPKWNEATVAGESNVTYQISDYNLGTDVVNLEFRYHAPVAGVKELNADFSGALLLYPNPAGSNAFIEVNAIKTIPGAKLEIYNALGQKVLAKEVYLETGKNNIGLDTEGLESGIYFVSLNAGVSSITNKLTIKN